MWQPNQLRKLSVGKTRAATNHRHPQLVPSKHDSIRSTNWSIFIFLSLSAMHWFGLHRESSSTLSQKRWSRPCKTEKFTEEQADSTALQLCLRQLIFLFGNHLNVVTLDLIQVSRTDLWLTYNKSSLTFHNIDILKDLTSSKQHQQNKNKQTRHSKQDNKQFLKDR